MVWSVESVSINFSIILTINLVMIISIIINSTITIVLIELIRFETLTHNPTVQTLTPTTPYKVEKEQYINLIVVVVIRNISVLQCTCV